MGMFIQVSYFSLCIMDIADNLYFFDVVVEIFPFAMDVVDSETKQNWFWFLNHLKVILPSDRVFTFVSDRHWGLVKSIPKVFPNSYHSYCKWHLKNNLSTCFPAKSKKKSFILQLFVDCAYASTHLDFQSAFDDLKSAAGKEINEFLKKAPIDHWANAYFPGQRYGMMCSNIAESFNGWIVKERTLPITSMLDKIRVKLMIMMSNRRESSRNWNTVLCPDMETLLSEKINTSKTWKVMKSNDFVFEVQEEKTHKVDLYYQHCSCNDWKIEGFPCNHVVLSILADGKCVYDFCDPCFLSVNYQRSYSHAIFPISNADRPGEVTNELHILPPEVKRTVGRPKRNRVPNAGSKVRKMRKCGRCHHLGFHNKKTCSESIH